jgi:CDGSH-type Zn-finger protein
MDDEVRITPYEDGPYLIRGPFKLVDADGNEIDPGRKTVALCRCGRSRIKPFCDGMHKTTRFQAASAPDGPRPNPSRPTSS